jgi:MoaA/NifB/PqqE/SkfB family radical SAM enzyme
LFDISVSYLINDHNHDVDEVLSFIRDFNKAGCNMLRFAFAQPPKDIETETGVIPTKESIFSYIEKLRPVIEAENSPECMTMLVNADDEHDIYNKPRTLPCFARFVYPTIGFDGWLYQCSQSSSPNFHQTALGDLNTENFWDLLYNYEGDQLDNYFKSCSQKLTDSGCRCDRKEHILNEGVIASRVFDDVLKV